MRQAMPRCAGRPRRPGPRMRRSLQGGSMMPLTRWLPAVTLAESRLALSV